MHNTTAPQFEKGWNFNDSKTNEATLKPLCSEAEKHFTLPPHRLYRYFAIAEDNDLLRMVGRYYRGFYSPFSLRNNLPSYLRDSFFLSMDEIAASERMLSLDEMTAFDSLVYIRHNTCLDATGCVITYAHELQHFVQHGHTPRLWAVNSVLYEQLRNFEPRAIAIDVPHEREANIVSKRVAEAVCGTEAVRTFIEEQVRLMELAGDANQTARWVFLRDVPSSTNYNLLEATMPLVEKYKTLIDFEMDVNVPEWWVGPLDED
jgi:hypothetical protein